MTHYQAPFFLKNGHIQSIYPSLFRKLEANFYHRERITTSDDDFLDLDWSRTGNDHLVILSHGLEGNSKRSYILGMAKSLNQNGWDTLSWNFRSCSGELNKQLRFYHSGATDDLHQVITHVLENTQYKSISLVGYSMGGNITLLYLGKQGSALHPKIQRAVCFSVPCDLASSSKQLGRFSNKIYMNHFLTSLKKKLQAKSKLYPKFISLKDYSKIKTFTQYDDRYTAPIHGFQSAADYYQSCSSRPWLPHIPIPTLLVNALNDPFLSPECYPQEEMQTNPHFFFRDSTIRRACRFY